MSAKLIFRAEASQTIGRGHLSRCIAIADMLRHEFNVSFAFLRNEEDFASRFINNYPYFLIDSEDELVTILQKEDFFWLDGYHFKEDRKQKIRKRVKKIIETNDIPYHPQNVDIIVNHTPGLTEDQYVDYTNTALYLGLDYALLRQSFLNIAKKPIHEPKGEGVFICFGGADTYQLGSKFVNALLMASFKEPIYWVTNDSSIVTNAKLNSNVTILSNLSEVEMIHYMSIAKVLLIPSSVLSFEGIAIRKPIFTCYFVDNQKLIHQGLIKDELVLGVGFIETTADVDRVLNPFLNFYNNIEIHRKHIKNQSMLLDGNSGERIKKILFKGNSRKI